LKNMRVDEIHEASYPIPFTSHLPDNVNLATHSIGDGTTRTVDNSDRGQLGPWTTRSMDSSARGLLGPLDYSALGQLGPWTARPLDNSDRGQLGP
jgi:hypothetical protein